MKLLAALAIMFASIADVPAPCAHAMGQVAEALPTTEMVHTGHDRHAHHSEHSKSTAGHAHHARHDNGAPEIIHDNAHDCSDGCEGGVGCDGCTITNAAISEADKSARHIAAHSIQPVITMLGVDKPATLDPPPPRA